VTAVRGTVISIHAHGATVRLDDGSLAVVSESELAAHRPVYVDARDRRERLALQLAPGERPTVSLERPAPPSPASLLDTNARFEAHMDAYLKSTEAWAPQGAPPPAERHFIRKKRRAALFEARSSGA